MGQRLQYSQAIKKHSPSPTSGDIGHDGRLMPSRVHSSQPATFFAECLQMNAKFFQNVYSPESLGNLGGPPLSDEERRGSMDSKQLKANRVSITSKLGATLDETQKKVKNKLNLGLIRTQTQYYKDPAHQININLQPSDNHKLYGLHGISVTEEESEVVTPMQPIEPKVDALFDSLSKQDYPPSLQDKKIGSRQILTFEKQLKMQNVTSPLSQRNLATMDSGSRDFVDKMSNAISARASYPTGLNTSGAGATMSCTTAARSSMPHQLRTAVQLEKYKGGMGISLDLNHAASRAEMMSGTSGNANILTDTLTQK